MPTPEPLGSRQRNTMPVINFEAAQPPQCSSTAALAIQNRAEFSHGKRTTAYQNHRSKATLLLCGAKTFSYADAYLRKQAGINDQPRRGRG